MIRSAIWADLLVVGDHDDGLAELLGSDLQESHHVQAGGGVQVAGGLIRQDDGGLGRQSPGDGHPLLLAAGEVVGQVLELCLQPQGLNDPFHIGFVRRVAVQLDGQDDVLIHVQHRHQVVVLEHKADLPPPEDGQFLIPHGREFFAVHRDGAAGGAVQPAQHVEQGGLAGAGGPTPPPPSPPPPRRSHIPSSRSFVSKIVIVHSSKEKSVLPFDNTDCTKNLSTFFLKSNSSERFGMSGPERAAFYVLSSALGRNREKVLPSRGGC